MQAALQNSIHDDNWQHYDAELGRALAAISATEKAFDESREALGEMVEQFGHYCEHTEDENEVAALRRSQRALGVVVPEGEE